MDRRILKTRQAIMEAFIGLIEERGFEKITIHAIADRANVNRGTVYLHFTDKYDLLEQCIETYLQLLYESCIPDGEPGKVPSKALLLRTFEFLERHALVYSTLMTSKGVPAFRKRMMAMMEISIEEHIKSNGIGPSMNREILAQFLTIAVAGLVEWWIINSMPYTPSEMVDQLMMILEHNLNLQG
ncbi:TetR/AcrR family transcriptional regulator [Paenibacillus sp. FSL W8-0186]|uniref:TetR family transcriptional regulator n=1 Tax=Paenibacillus woosongensis TaxID=307580 RepID=A0ABQ4MVX3_9BACL|nr:TetR/AcrR family transcriptional regulator [Paenibacillus woosongensis]GIP60075.1 TetR family transcriptional regulator [Paenibacillus woosongensis]